jgi:hypothetical protein
MNNVQYLLAQIGKNSERRFAGSLPLEPSELPDGEWRIYDEKLWRSGRFGGNGELERRAMKAGTYDILRSYGQPGASKAVLIEVRQLASQSDAVAEVPIARLHLKITSERSESNLTEAKVIEDPLISGKSSAIYFEQFARKGERRNTYRYAVDSIDRVVLLTACVAMDEGSPWEEVFELNSLQADRIRTKLATEQH